MCVKVVPSDRRFHHGITWHDVQNAAAAVQRSGMSGPAPFCSWLIEGSVLISSYLDTEVLQHKMVRLNINTGEIFMMVAKLQYS